MIDDMLQSVRYNVLQSSYAGRDVVRLTPSKMFRRSATCRETKCRSLCISSRISDSCVVWSGIGIFEGDWCEFMSSCLSLATSSRISDTCCIHTTASPDPPSLDPILDLTIGGVDSLRTFSSSSDLNGSKLSSRGFPSRLLPGPEAGSI